MRSSALDPGGSSRMREESVRQGLTDILALLLPTKRLRELTATARQLRTTSNRQEAVWRVVREAGLRFAQGNLIVLTARPLDGEKSSLPERPLT